MRKTILPSFVLFLCISVSAQTVTTKIKVFLDCTQSWLCDFDYVRTEMKMVDFVRDRFDAEVHVLVNTQNSSSGGTQATLTFIGHQRFEGASDTLTYFNDPTTTQDDQRKKLVRYLKLGLVRYIAKTTVGEQLQISYAASSGSDSTLKPAKDKWKYWVYQVGANGNLTGSQNYKERYVNGFFSADKETENWKINLALSANKDVQTYIQDSTQSKFTRKEYSFSGEVAKSLTPHWSYGVSAAYINSLFSNVRAGFKLRPKLEYSLFPYSRFNTQRIVIQYLVGPVHNTYYDSTIFFKTWETQLLQSANLITSFTKPWGAVNLGVFYSNYFDDFSKNELTFNGAISWRIVKGLNFALWGNYGLIHDQIGLRKGNFTRDELLVKNRELKSSFQYNLGVGFSYRFGSIMNSIVNPRFKGLNYSINL